MRPICLFLLMMFICAQATAQKVWITGYLRDSITHFQISGGTLTNTDDKQQVKTNTNGLFRLQANPGNLIYAVAPGYANDTFRVPALYADTLVIYLSPTGVTLGNVTVRSNYNKYQLDSIDRRNTFEALRGNPVKTVSRPNSGGFGVGINLDRVFKDKYRGQKKKEKFFSQRERDAYIDFRFSPHVVAQYTGLKGESLRQFMYHHRPSYNWLRDHPTNEALLYYINDEVKKFRAAQGKKSTVLYQPPF